MRRAPAIVVVAAVLWSIAGCGASTSGPTFVPGGPTAGPDESLPDGGESVEPEPTEPDSTAIPGFDGWGLVNAGAVDIGETESGFGMALTKQATWSGSGRGVLFSTTIQGDFRLSATVRATRTSDSSETPGGDGTTQLAGLMARLAGAPERYVFLAVGGDASGLTVATNSTRAGDTKLATPTWPAAEAGLKLCRVGATFTLWKRAADSDDDWAQAGSFERKDLDGMVQVGAALSADAAPDLTALFEDLTLEPLDVGEAC